MCEESIRKPNTLQLLAFRQVAQNKSSKDLEFINQIPFLCNYFNKFEFVVTSDHHIVKKGVYKSKGFIVRGGELLAYIKNKLSQPDFSINFWCRNCRSFCEGCRYLYESWENRYSTHVSICNAYDL